MVASKADPYNIFALVSQRNPDLYERMRNDDPVHCAVHPQTGGKFWFLTRYDDCLSFLKDKRFGKESQRSLSENDLIDEIINQHMLNRDDPAHARLKALVHLTFTPLRIHHLRPQIQLIADGLFDMIDAEVADGDEFDLTQRYITQLPLMAIASLLGIPMQDYQNLYIWQPLKMWQHGRSSLRKWGSGMIASLCLIYYIKPLVQEINLKSSTRIRATSLWHDAVQIIWSNAGFKSRSAMSHRLGKTGTLKHFTGA